MLTQGLGTILRARHLLLLATGAGKAEASRQPSKARSPPPAPRRSSSSTRTCPSWWTRAAARLGPRDHYREVYDAKPDWQGL